MYKEDDGFLDLVTDKSEESLLIEEADLNMANPNLVDFTVDYNAGKIGCALTTRVWIVGIFLAIIMSIITQMMMMRTIPLMVNPLIQLVLAYPLGNLCVKILPNRVLNIFGYPLNLNPGPFSLREHALVMLISNGGNAPSLGLVVEVVRESFFNQDRSATAGFLSGLASCLVGVALGGLASRIVVYPEEMVWPSSLMYVSLTKALHERRYFPSASRIKFFWIVTACAFGYQFLPGFLFTSLTSLSFLCWIMPSSPILSQVGSGLKGLGVGSLSLDWSLIVSFMPSPLVYPFYAAANLFTGFAIFMWILVPLGYYNNIWDTQRYPIQSFNLYDSQGLPYNTDRVQKNGILNDSEYYSYGPVRITWMFFNAYFISIAAVSAAVTHVALYHGLDLADHFVAFYRSLKGKTKMPKMGRRKKLASNHPMVPIWCYLVLLMFAILMGTISIRLTQAKEFVSFTVILLAVIIALIFIIPISWIAGLTSHQINIHILVELIAGVIWPGNGPANMYFRTYSYFTIFVAIEFCIDFKFGLYMKLPPQQILFVKVIGILITSTTQAIVTYSLLNTIPNMCNLTHPTWACTYFNGLKPSAFIWGTVGPTKLFGSSSIYHPMVYALLLGFFLPIPFYILQAKFPKITWLSYINIPIMLSGSVFAPAAPSAQFFTWFLTAFVCNHLVYKYRKSWWLRKNLLLSAGLDTGTMVASFIIVLIVSTTGFHLDWWGNDPLGNCPLASIPLHPSLAAQELFLQKASH